MAHPEDAPILRIDGKLSLWRSYGSVRLCVDDGTGGCVDLTPDERTVLAVALAPELVDDVHPAAVQAVRAEAAEARIAELDPDPEAA